MNTGELSLVPEKNTIRASSQVPSFNPSTPVGPVCLIGLILQVNFPVADTIHSKVKSLLRVQRSRLNK